MREFFRKLSWIAKRRMKEDDLGDELRFHLEEETAEREAEGLAKSEAALAARRQLGNVTLVLEDTRATWGWGVETGSHALRLIFHGTFDRFPKAKLLLGHLGETLPFLLWRFDSRAKLYGVRLAKRPSDYIRENIAVTTSGMFAADPLLCTLNALGRRQVMFSADYPFESADEAAAFIDNVALDDEVRADICFGNAQRLLRL